MRRISLATNAALSAEWHPAKNGPLKPDDVTESSSEQIWWKCQKGFDHVWPASPASRRAGAGCPFCLNRRVSVTNSLAAMRPDVAAEWHKTKNALLRPTGVVASSRAKAWWQCLKSPGHVWQAPVLERTGPRALGCPFCLGRRPAPSNSLERVRPELAALWHPTRNGLTPAEVSHGSIRVVWWLCPLNKEHEWRAAVCDRGLHGCPFCANRRASKSSSLSAKNKALAREWHPAKNGDLRPTGVVPTSNRRVWWRCQRDPTHEWEAMISRRTAGSKCPFCSGRRFKRGGPGSLLAEAPAVSRQWHPTRNGKVTPADVSVKSRHMFWWRCKAGPDHEWQSTPAHRGGRGQGCPFCAGFRVSVTNSIATLRPQLAAEWHPTRNRPLTPHDLTPGSHHPVVWQCTRNARHVWSTTPHARRGCPFCSGWR